MASFTSQFTATKLQVATYLLGVALFSISFLVFLNSTVSFVVTDIIGRREAVGDAVGTLGFADELVIILMCPVWGSMSDRIGVRTVAVVGYVLVGISLFVFVQAKNVYPQLLLARILFSLGAAATATMVTAILPTMTMARESHRPSPPPQPSPDVPTSRLSNLESVMSDSSEVTITPDRFLQESSSSPSKLAKSSGKSSSSLIAGLVGMCTGLGALLALGGFLPLPARLGKTGYSRTQALSTSYYIVGAVALFVGLICFFGLRNLAGEESKGWRLLFQKQSSSSFDPSDSTSSFRIPPFLHRFRKASVLGLTDVSISLGYLGGFVARASSVAITLFIPLFVNAYFITSGLCQSDPDSPSNDPSDIKSNCRRAYTVAAALTGVSQTVALLAAPLIGWLDGRFHQHLNGPLVISASLGVIGYCLLANVRNPDYKTSSSAGALWVSLACIGFSQIGAIVCSLSSISRGIDGDSALSRNHHLSSDEYVPSQNNSNGHNGSSSPAPPHYSHHSHLPRPTAHLEPESDSEQESESSSLLSHDREATTRTSPFSPTLPSHLTSLPPTLATPSTRTDLKGTIAGIYSLSGGLGILLLTKLGGYMFDNTSVGAPFYMLAAFNAFLLVVALLCGVASIVVSARSNLRGGDGRPASG